MKAICIDGIPNDGVTTLRLPELVTLDVYEFGEDPDYYWVLGYEQDPNDGGLVVWHKRRFLPLSEIDEIAYQSEQESRSNHLRTLTTAPVGDKKSI